MVLFFASKVMTNQVRSHLPGEIPGIFYICLLPERSRP